MRKLKFNKLLFYHKVGLDIFNNFFVVRLMGGFVFYILPAIVMLIVGISFFNTRIDQPYSNQQYQILISAFGFTATMSGLLFTAKSSTKDPIKEEIYYGLGERFLHATILFAFAAISRFAIS